MKRSVPCLLALAPLLVSALAGAEGLPNYDASYAAKPSVSEARTAPRGAPAAHVASMDARRGVPTFLWAARDVGRGLGRIPGMTAERAARAHLERHAAHYGLVPEALATARVQQIHDTGRGGIVVVLRQAPGGIEVFHDDVKVLLDRDLDVVAIGGNLHAAAVARPRTAPFSRRPPESILAALADLYGIVLDPTAILDTKQTSGGYHDYIVDPAVLAAKGLRLGRAVRVKHVYFPIGNKLVPGHFLEIDGARAGSAAKQAYGYVIAADDGRVLYRQNLTHDVAYSYRVYADPTGDFRPMDGPIADFTPHPTGTPDGSYPAFAAPSLITIEGFNKFKDPWLPGGAQQTKGNNVDAYTDNDTPDGFSSGDVRATLTGPFTFDRTYDPSLSPQANATQRMAAVTNIFYVTNWLHDWWYDSGFDEVAGNAQATNYGRGGLGNDALHAQGQDGAPFARNNANMSVFADGSPPRMQMYVWDGKSSASLSVTPLVQNFATGVANFGPQSFDVSGTVVLVDDGTGTVTDACETIDNDVSGKIALVRRGTCSFESKVQRAEAAGAIGVLLYNDQGGPQPPPMGGDPGSGVTIPVLSITQSAGNAIINALAGGPVTAALHRDAAPDRDGTIDNTVVAHEWGHYIHLRQVECSSAACSAESEGWGDFFALHMSLREGDDRKGAFPAAVYATAAQPDDPGYFGIRRYPYSVDFAKNALTFKHIADGEPLPSGVPVAEKTAFVNNAEQHAAGEVWASMLFEAYVALLDQTAGAGPKYTFDEARRRMGDYVEVGLKLAPADPTYTEQRDAILAAAAAADDAGDLDVLAAAFARRGAGTCAVSPPRDSLDLSGVKESFTVQPNVTIVSMTIDDSVKSCDEDGRLDAEETGKLVVTVMNGGTKALAGASAKASSTTPGLSFSGGAMLSFGPIPPLGTASASIEVTLDPKLTKLSNADIAVELLDVASCEGKVAAAIAPLVNFDQVEAAAAIDTVEADVTSWTTEGEGGDLIWSRAEITNGNHVWAGVDYPSPSDTSLVSPSLMVSTTDPLVLSFRHRHAFELGDGVAWDGSVIEVSIDGKQWEDISAYGDPGYGGTIGDPTGQASNVLRDRQGYVGTSAGWPALDSVKIDMGTKLAGQNVRIRFRIGTDDAAGSTGWALDDIQLDGIVGTPFAAIIDDKGSCGSPPSANAGPDQQVTSSATVKLDGTKSSDPEGVPLTFAWKQVAGAAVTLSDAASATPTFEAPRVSAPETLSFALTVSDSSAEATDTVDVVVTPGGGNDADAGTGSTPEPAAAGGCDCNVQRTGDDAGAAAAMIALLGLAMRRRRR